MNFEDIKKKATDIKNDLEPKVKNTAKKAGKAVSDFMDDHFGDNSNNEENAINENDVIDAEYVEAEPLTEENNAEGSETGSGNSFKKKKNRKKAKTVKYKEAEDLTEENNSDTDNTVADDATVADDQTETANDPEAQEAEHVEGEIVETAKEKYSQMLQSVVPKVVDTATTVGEKVKDAAVAVGGKVKDVAEDITPKVRETFRGMGPKAKETVENIGPKVKETVKRVGPSLRQSAKRTGETISFQGYRLRKTIGRKVKGSIKAKFGIKDDEKDGIKYYETKKKSSSKLVMHTRTILAHRHMVLKHCIKAGIPIQGLLHDLSKFSPQEFKYGVKFYRGDRSPNEGEREDHGFSYAWMHHKGRNKHHFEYWNDYNIAANKALPVKMPLKYVIEMFCDRVAASKIYLKDKYTEMSPYEYFDKGRSRRTIHKETSDFLEKLLKMLAQKGEDYTFMYIKWYMKHHKDY